MDFQSLPDEGYSEDPLSASTTTPGFSLKSIGGGGNEAVAAVAARLFQTSVNSELSPLLAEYVSGLSLASKTQLAQILLDELPTSIVVEIVNKLSPRLYIDFVQYLPAEICLKILGHLDPLSLVSVARSCRAWYGLALDRKLWERLYYLEGWKALTAEIDAYEDKINRDRPVPSSEASHAYKKRAISALRGEHVDVEVDGYDDDNNNDNKGDNDSIDHVMIDVDITAANSSAAVSSSSSSFSRKGKERAHSSADDLPRGAVMTRAVAAVPPSAPFSSHIPRTSLWMWDMASRRYRISWKHLYSMRRRLEANWELGKYTNFQFPHPDFPGEAHGECIYTLQFNNEYLVSGSRDRTIRIWSMRTRRLVRAPLCGHRGSVLCLQFDSDAAEDLIVSGSSDSSVILWRFSTGEILQRLGCSHREPVLNVKFDKHVLVTCSKDKTIKVFNRRELRPGDLGYECAWRGGDSRARTGNGSGGGLVKGVSPVPIQLDYGYEGLVARQPQPPAVPPFTLLSTLEGHNAAVNAVQVLGREVVSASGDRNVKIWDWPNQTCLRTFLGHSKGIACVQYDGRRIVSGSSDNEVKVFDRRSSVEVASLRAHVNLVRTVQAGFGDLPYSVHEDEREAAETDRRFLEAMQNGRITQTPTLRRRGGGGQQEMDGADGLDGADGARDDISDHPSRTRRENFTFTGAKLPPGGGGGKYGRIVSGSYDTTIIIWRRDKYGVWKAQHRLKQEEAAVAAAAAVSARQGGRDQQQRRHAGASRLNEQQQEPAADSVVVPSAIPAMTSHIDEIVAQGVQALQQALVRHPELLTMQAQLQAATDQHPSPFVRSHLRQAISTALVRAQIAQSRAAATAAAAGAGGVNGVGGAGGVGGSGGLGGSESASSVAPSDLDVVAAAVASSASSAPVTAVPEMAPGVPSMPEQATTGATTPLISAAATAAIATTTDTAAVTAISNVSISPPAAVAAPVTATAAAAVASPTMGVARPAAHRHLPLVEASHPVSVYKLQFDARQIICCSRGTTIVGWDFCNGDAELEKAARFFGTVD